MLLASSPWVVASLANVKMTLKLKIMHLGLLFHAHLYTTTKAIALLRKGRNRRPITRDSDDFYEFTARDV